MADINNKSKEASLKGAADNMRLKAEELAYKKIKRIPEFSSEKILHMFFELETHKIELEMQNEELRQAQAKLENSKKRYFDLYDMAPIGYCTISEEGLITEANLTISTLLGVPRSELTKKRFSQFIYSKDQDMYYFYRKKYFSIDQPKPIELRLLKSDGTEFWVWLNTRIVKNTNGMEEIFLMVDDISERKKVEEESILKDKVMIAQSKQAAMGEMIAMIAHQWRQPLSSISIAVSNFKVAVELEEQITIDDFNQCYDVVSTQIEQLSTTIDDFRHFFKPNQEREYMTIEDVLNIALMIIGKSLENNNITLTVHNTSKKLLYIQKTSLVQVFLNILNNAKEACLVKEIVPATISISINENEDEVVIVICDNAGGIKESILDKIGEPYLTTKGLNGTGLGIYIAKVIVEKHLYGSLSWGNKDQGACFMITLDTNKNS